MTIINFILLPFEIRELIYQICVRDQESRTNVLTLNREIHGEVEKVIYDQRSLVFRTHPDFILNHQVKTLRQLQKGLVTLALEHPRKAPLALPSLPWKKKRSENEPSYRHLPIDYLIKKAKGKIMIHVHEPPEQELSQLAMSYWAVNGIHEFIQELYPEETLRLQIITHPLSQLPTFVGETRFINHSWAHNLCLEFYERTSGGLSLILATLWADTDVHLDIHTTGAIAQHLAKFGFYSKPKRGKNGTRFLGFFPPLEPLNEEECLLPEGAVVTFRGNTWKSKDMECLCPGIGCACANVDFADVAVMAAVSYAAVREDKTSMAMRNMGNIDFTEFSWNNPDTAIARYYKEHEAEYEAREDWCWYEGDTDWDYFASSDEENDQDQG